MAIENTCMIEKCEKELIPPEMPLKDNGKQSLLIYLYIQYIHYILF